MDCLDDITRKLQGLLTREEVEDIYHKIASKVTRENLMFGRKKTATEKDVAAYEERLKTLSPVKRIQSAAQEAFKEAVHEKKQVLRREYLQAEINARNDNYIGETGQKINGHVKALINLLVGDVRGRQDTLTLQGRMKGILQLDMAEMYDAIDTYMGKFGFKFTEEQALNIIREMDGIDTGDSAAKKLVETWTKLAERSRDRKNNRGADIGFLRDWRLPQVWDPAETKKFGLTNKEKLRLLDPRTSQAEKYALYDKARLQWIDEAFKRVDRARYTDLEGMPLDDEQLRVALNGIFNTIVTRGLNEVPIVIGAQKSLAQQLGEHRELHFKSAGDWYEFNKLSGKLDIFGLMQRTIIGNAKDTALLETFGPNPQVGFRTALAQAQALDAMIFREKTHKEGVGRAQAYFDEITGASRTPLTEREELFANAMLGLRQWMVATKLGSLLLSQVNDLATYSAIASTDGLGVGKALRFVTESLNPFNESDRFVSMVNGIATQTMINDIGLRYGEAVQGTSFTSKMANMTVRLSGAEYWTNSAKMAFQRLIGFHLNRAVEMGLEHYDPLFKAMLRRYGIGEAEWGIIQRAEAVAVSGEKMITPVAVKNVENTPAAREAAIKVAAMLAEEADIAIVSPGAREMALMKSRTTPGTISGEFMRSIALFKTFTVSLTTKVLPRIFAVEGTGGYRAGMAASFALGMIIAGGISYQLKQIAFGRNPRDITTPGFWFAAASQSGGLGIFGDFLFADYNRFGRGAVSTIGGPVAGLAEELGRLTIGNAVELMRGKETKIRAETFQFFKNQTPLINLWYTRAALDHLLFFQLQEAANPGYLRRMKRRVERENEQTFWWAPTETLPEEKPDIEYMFGGKKG